MPDAGRQYAYDVVRVVAMTFVVAVHSLVVIDQSSTILFLVFAVGQAVFFTANALFFMLSGKFNMRERETPTDLARYYVRRFRGFGHRTPPSSPSASVARLICRALVRIARIRRLPARIRI